MKAPRIVTKLPGPKAKALMERDRSSVSPSYTRMLPLVAARGSGVVIEDIDGNRFLDFSSGIAVTATGHCHPQVVAAIREQSEQLIHMSGTDFYYAPQIELAEALGELAPVSQTARAFFCNSGTEAIEAALKLARYKTGRPHVIAFFGSFHGRTLGALSLTASKSVQRRGFQPLPGGAVHAPYPHCARCPLRTDDADCCLESLRFIEQTLFHHLVPPDEVAAIMVEPILGEGGYVVPPPEFLAGLRRICDQHGILLIADEVQSGMGRSGKLFALDHTEILADIVCVAKGIASGMPLGVTLASRQLMDWPPGSHASTFGGNPISCAAGLATLKLLRQELVANAVAVGAHIQDRLRNLCSAYPCMGQVRGLGLMIGIEIVDGAGQEDSDLCYDLIESCFHEGLVLIPAGRSVIRFVPPLVVTKQEADRAIEIFAGSLERCAPAS